MEEKGPEGREEEPPQETNSKGALPSFDEVFMVSALSGDGVEQVKVTTDSLTNVYSYGINKGHDPGGLCAEGSG